MYSGGEKTTIDFQRQIRHKHTTESQYRCTKRGLKKFKAPYGLTISQKLDFTFLYDFDKIWIRNGPYD